MPDSQETRKRLTEAYNRMLERVREVADETTGEALPAIQKGVDKARETAVELGELTREEAEKIGAWLKRDLQDAGHYLSETGHELGDWLRFDLGLIEDRLVDLLTGLADKTALEWMQLDEQFRETVEYRSGEVTGPGTLICKSCGQAIHFHDTAHIPPCPKCHSSQFRRPMIGEEIEPTGN